MPQKMTKFCILGNESSVEDSLLRLNITKSQIKKTNLSKKFLDKKLDKTQEIEIPLNLVNQGLVHPIYIGPKIEVIFEDKKIICVNKPHNIHCYPLQYDDQKNVLSFLRENLFLKKTDFCFERDYEGGLLYRLDFETSGVLFLSKEKDLYLLIRKNFKNVAKTKEYICIVDGKFENPGPHRHFLSAFGPKKSRIRVKENGELGEGILDIDILDYDIERNLTLLKIKLFTGIRHQIRVQLSHLGYPILGDVLYGGRPSDRLFLHAFKYAILIEDKNYEIVSKNAFLFDRFFNLNSIF